MRSVIALALLGLSSCNLASRSSFDVKETPKIDGKVTKQGGLTENLCNQGGHKGQTTGKGWTFDSRQGCYLNCKSRKIIEDDFLNQLKLHRTFGDINLVKELDPAAAETMETIRKSIKSKGFTPHDFSGLTKDQLYDGSDWKKLGIQPGDIFLHMFFGLPDHIGLFYSKHGVSHLSMVTKVTETGFWALNGGQGMTFHTEVMSQSIWLRPKMIGTKEQWSNDLKNLVKWSKTFENLSYDNTLIDDIAMFRSELDRQLDSKKSPLEARTLAFAYSATKKVPPFGYDQSFQFQPPSGQYCSEGAATIFSYLGFKLLGQSALESLGSFRKDGGLPQWEAYEDALVGIGAASDEKLRHMHLLYYNYFKKFDSLRKRGIVTLEGQPKFTEISFQKAALLNFEWASRGGGKSNHLLEQLKSAMLSEQLKKSEKEELKTLVEGLDKVTKVIATRKKQDINFTQALLHLYFVNKQYSPASFMENSAYFDLKGVFYNTNFGENSQALNVSTYFLQYLGGVTVSGNISTTLYKLDPDNSKLPDDRCEIGDQAPML